MGSVENFAMFMRAVESVSQVPICYGEISSGAKGYYSHTDKEIVIQEDMSEIQTMKMGIHETVHAILHDKNVMEETGKGKTA